MNDQELPRYPTIRNVPKRTEEATITRAAELLGVATEGRYFKDILADVVLRLSEALAAEREKPAQAA